MPHWLPSTPFRFTTTRVVVVLAPDIYEEVGVLEGGATCRAVEASGPWVFAEDRSGHRGWVPLGVVPVWHPAAPALLGVIVSVLATAAAAVTGFVAAINYTGCLTTCGDPNRAAGVALMVSAALVLVVGMWLARRVGTGGRGRLSWQEAAAITMAPAALGAVLGWGSLDAWEAAWSAGLVLVLCSWLVWRAAARHRGGQ